MAPPLLRVLVVIVGSRRPRRVDGVGVLRARLAHPRGADLVMMNEATEKLIDELRGSPIDLAKLVESIRWPPCRVVNISAEPIIRWRKDDPPSGRRVLEWKMNIGADLNGNESCE